MDINQFLDPVHKIVEDSPEELDERKFLPNLGLK
jgi:hypothetical protein